ncbi:hypothetical protein KIN34_03070 [Cellulomonas sp. DKR-3]|uniref:Uncharacterized protein n=1 Tax=Cellulomonas fulva TaxID=2835530 RepID=A0ABS5TVS9_9CELL|nr:hypothetical protein [Cellulomonas fulva]MBT0993269.1 hypothetical protein [Cellulomonas fulva]
MSDGGRPDDPNRPGEPPREPGAAAGPASPGSAAAPPAPDDAAAKPAARPRWLLPVAIGAGVLVVVAVVVGIVLATGGDDEEALPPEPVVATTIRLPSPTPSVEPVARTATTPFAATLPTTVLQYALASSKEAAGWLDQGALEAYVEEYTDGGDATVTVQAGQLETAEDAKKLAQTLTEDLPLAQAAGGADDATAPADDATGKAPDPAPTAGRDQLPQTGPVRVGDQRVGTYTAADLGDGTAVVVWFNGTGVFRVVAPVADALDFYRAYPV